MNARFYLVVYLITIMAMWIGKQCVDFHFNNQGNCITDDGDWNPFPKHKGFGVKVTKFADIYYTIVFTENGFLTTTQLTRYDSLFNEVAPYLEDFELSVKVAKTLKSADQCKAWLRNVDAKLNERPGRDTIILSQSKNKP